MRWAVLGLALLSLPALAWPGFTLRAEFSSVGTVFELGHYSLLALPQGDRVWMEATLGKADLTLGGFWTAGLGVGVTPDLPIFLGGGLRFWAYWDLDWLLSDVYLSPYFHVLWLWRNWFMLGIRLTFPPVLQLDLPLGGPYISVILGITF